MNQHHETRKRTRDDQGDHEVKRWKEYSHEGKKPAETTDIDSSYKLEKAGVFDFPWLKDGVVFKADEYLEPQYQEYALGTCSSYLNEDPTSFPDSSDSQNIVPPNGRISNLDDDEIRSWSFLIENDLEPVDCIWRCVIDQPLDIIGLNKP